MDTIKNYGKEFSKELIAFLILAIGSGIAISSGDYAWYYGLIVESPIFNTIIFAGMAAAILYVLVGASINWISNKYKEEKEKTFKKYVYSFVAYSIALYVYIFAVEFLVNGIAFSWFHTIFGNPRGAVFNSLDTAVIISMMSYIVMFIYGDKELTDKVSNLIKFPKKQTESTTVETDVEESSAAS